MLEKSKVSINYLERLQREMGDSLYKWTTWATEEDRSCKKLGALARSELSSRS
jgi:hypothetical protein